LFKQIHLYYINQFALCAVDIFKVWWHNATLLDIYYFLIELEPALQQAEALPTELRRTLLNHAAPYWATQHPTELHRTLLSHAAPY
jgi:hypothetical protein